jgi:hypothetical protein
MLRSILTLIAGILIIIFPGLLRWIVGIYLIVIGLEGLLSGPFGCAGI